jgi:transcriptional repressor NrdR
MRCPYCHGTEDKVVDSRTSQEGRSVRRRRECVSCGRRFTTYEYVEERQLLVKKAGGSSQPFERRKLEQALGLACAKRPISRDDIEAMVGGVEDQLLQIGEDEIESGRIGELVMEQLKARDHVAYVRYASVYRNFKDLDEFYEELKDLSARRALAAQSRNQVELPLQD